MSITIQATPMHISPVSFSIARDSAVCLIPVRAFNARILPVRSRTF